jgi:hypothetical protein
MNIRPINLDNSQAELLPCEQQLRPAQPRRAESERAEPCNQGRRPQGTAPQASMVNRSLYFMLCDPDPEAFRSPPPRRPPRRTSRGGRRLLRSARVHDGDRGGPVGGGHAAAVVAPGGDLAPGRRTGGDHLRRRATAGVGTQRGGALPELRRGPQLTARVGAPAVRLARRGHPAGVSSVVGEPRRVDSREHLQCAAPLPCATARMRR